MLSIFMRHIFQMKKVDSIVIFYDLNLLVGTSSRLTQEIFALLVRRSLSTDLLGGKYV